MGLSFYEGPNSNGLHRYHLSAVGGLVSSLGGMGHFQVPCSCFSSILEAREYNYSLAIIVLVRYIDCFEPIANNRDSPPATPLKFGVSRVAYTVEKSRSSKGVLLG